MGAMISMMGYETAEARYVAAFVIKIKVGLISCLASTAHSQFYNDFRYLKHLKTLEVLGNLDTQHVFTT